MSLQFFVPISKVDKERRMVWGYASTPTLDLQGERVALDAIKSALPDYMAWANIREMHQPSAVGVAKEANVDERGLFVGSKIVDEDAWQKCLEGVYKGYSIGGERISKQGDTITELKLLEISLVDRPANPDCRIEVTKAAGPLTAEDKAAAPQAVEAVAAPTAKGTPVEGEPVFTKQEVGFLGRIISKLSAPFSKAGAAHDGFSLPAASEWKPDPLAPNGGNPENARPLGHDGGRGGDATVSPPGRSDDGGPGLVELMDEKKDADSFSDKERDKLAEHGLAMRGGAEHGSYPIRNKADLERAIHAFGRAKNKAKVRAWIIHRAHELKATDLLPPDWPGSTKEEKTTLSSSLQKGLIESWCPGSNMTRLAAIYDELISLSRSLRWEADQEVGDKKDYTQAKKVSVLAQAVGTLLAEHAAEEVEEEKEREAARKSFHSAGITLETVTMTKSIFDAAGSGGAAGGDPEIAKRASEIGKVVHDHLTKAREHDLKAHKALMRAHEHFDKVCKCMGKSEEDATAREHLGHAHAALAEHFEHHMARGHHLHEAHKASAGWVGERSLAPGAAESVYKPEEGLTALAQRHMTEGHVPDYSADRPYPKAAGVGTGPSPVDVNSIVKSAVTEAVTPFAKQVETLTAQLNDANVAKAKAEGRAEALAAMPAGAPRPRLFSVDPGAFAGAAGVQKSDHDIVMEGVDVTAAQQDPEGVIKAAARMHGNKLFATITGRRNFAHKMTDPGFAGGAGR